MKSFFKTTYAALLLVLTFSFISCSNKENITLVEKELRIKLPDGYKILENKTEESWAPGVSNYDVKIQFNQEQIENIIQQIQKTPLFNSEHKHHMSKMSYDEREALIEKALKDNIDGYWIKPSEFEYRYSQVGNDLQHNNRTDAILDVKNKTLTFTQYANL
jgi:hypothetical protein